MHRTLLLLLPPIHASAQVHLHRAAMDLCISPSNLLIPIPLILTTSIDSPKLSSINLETIFFTFWAVSVADWEGLLSKPEMEKSTI